MRRLVWLACSSAILLTFPYPASATIVEQLATDALVARADRIVRGRVLEQRATWDDARERIYTDTTVEVAESYKGSRAQRIVVRRLGGSVDGIGMKAIGEVVFAPGEEVFLFLRRIPKGPSGDLHQTVGLSQGKLRIVRAAGSEPMVAFQPQGVTFMRREASGQTALVPAPPAQKRLAELETEVRQLVKGAR